MVGRRSCRCAQRSNSRGDPWRSARCVCGVRIGRWSPRADRGSRRWRVRWRCWIITGCWPRRRRRVTRECGRGTVDEKPRHRVRRSRSSMSTRRTRRVSSSPSRARSNRSRRAWCWTGPGCCPSRRVDRLAITVATVDSRIGSGMRWGLRASSTFASGSPTVGSRRGSRRAGR